MKYSKFIRIYLSPYLAIIYIEQKMVRYLRARRVKLLVSVREVEYRTFKSYLSACVCGCLSVNNAVRCSLLVLNMI